MQWILTSHFLKLTVLFIPLHNFNVLFMIMIMCMVSQKELQKKGIKFLSETDTEVIAQLIGLYLDKGLDTKEAVSRALSR